MVKGEAFWNLYLETQKSCDKQCHKCEMYLDHKKRCLHESLQAWEKWNKKKKEIGWNNESQTNNSNRV